MAYLGNPPSSLVSTSAITQTFTGDGGSTFNLTRIVTDNNPASLEVFVSNVQQQPTVSYSIVSGNVLTFSQAPGSGEPIYVIFRDHPSAPKVNIPDLAITTAKIQDSAITNPKIADSNISENKIATGAITNAKIADENVSENKIATGAITNAKIADANISENKIDSSAVTESKIATSAITNAKIADENVSENKIATSAVTSAKIASSSVGSAQLSSNLTIVGQTLYMGGAIERANVIANGITSNINVNTLEGGIVYFTGNSDSNISVTVNFTGLSSLSTGNIVPASIILTNNVTYNAYISAAQIDGTPANVFKWTTTPTAGDANVEVYGFSIIKTAASTYTVLGSKTNYS